MVSEAAQNWASKEPLISNDEERQYPNCPALPTSSLFPFLYFMIRDFGIAKQVEDIGFYAGFVGSSFMVGRALTSIGWGVAADRYGRQPIILIGTLSV
ncbi:Probable peptide/nitrate transporter At3g43790 [Dionaea muscipula]